MTDLIDKHITAILRLLDEADDIVSALYRQGANKDYKCKSLREKLREIEKELTEVDSVPKWIPCSERLSKPDEDVIIYYPRWEDNPIQVAHIMTDGLCWEFSDGEFYPGMGEVTHWMTLPELPEVDHGRPD